MGSALPALVVVLIITFSSLPLGHSQHLDCFSCLLSHLLQICSALQHRAEETQVHTVFQIRANLKAVQCFSSVLCFIHSFYLV